LFQDYRDYVHLGLHYSAFLQYSPFAGHLLYLADKFKKRNMSDYWWDNLDGSTQFTLTKAVMIAISELFGIYEDWLAPKFPISHTYYRAWVQNNANLVLLTPAVTLNQARLGPTLVSWRAQIDVFNPTCKPPCFLPESSTSRPTTTQPRHAAPSYASGNTSAVSVSSGITATSQTTNACSYPSTSQRNSDHRSGESSTSVSGKAATLLIIKTNYGFFKPLGDIVSDLNQN
jgi:hypothetical protein